MEFLTNKLWQRMSMLYFVIIDSNATYTYKLHEQEIYSLMVTFFICMNNDREEKYQNSYNMEQYLKLLAAN